MPTLDIKGTIDNVLRMDSKHAFWKPFHCSGFNMQDQSKHILYVPFKSGGSNCVVIRFCCLSYWFWLIVLHSLTGFCYCVVTPLSKFLGTVRRHHISFTSPHSVCTCLRSGVVVVVVWCSETRFLFYSFLFCT